MNQELNMKDLEQKTFKSTFQDGLMDIFIGLLLIAMSSNIYFARETVSWGYVVPDIHIVSIGMYAIIGLAMFLSKRYITVPRTGLVRLSKTRILKLRDFRIFGWIMIVSGISIGALVAIGQASGLHIENWRSLLAILITVIFMSSFAYAANLTGVKRLNLYGALFSLILPLGLCFKHLGIKNAVFLYIFLAALIMLIIGSVLLARFIKDHPLATDEDQEIIIKDSHHD